MSWITTASLSLLATTLLLGACSGDDGESRRQFDEKLQNRQAVVDAIEGGEFSDAIPESAAPLMSEELWNTAFISLENLRSSDGVRGDDDRPRLHLSDDFGSCLSRSLRGYPPGQTRAATKSYREQLTRCLPIQYLVVHRYRPAEHTERDDFTGQVDLWFADLSDGTVSSLGTVDIEGYSQGRRTVVDAASAALGTTLQLERPPTSGGFSLTGNSSIVWAGLLLAFLLPFLVLFVANQHMMSQYRQFVERYDLSVHATKSLGLYRHPLVSGDYMGREIQIRSESSSDAYSPHLKVATPELCTTMKVAVSTSRLPPFELRPRSSFNRPDLDPQPIDDASFLEYFEFTEGDPEAVLPHFSDTVRRGLFAHADSLIRHEPGHLIYVTRQKMITNPRIRRRFEGLIETLVELATDVEPDAGF